MSEVSVLSVADMIEHPGETLKHVHVFLFSPRARAVIPAGSCLLGAAAQS